MQQNSSDCGVFAAAYVTEMALSGGARADLQAPYNVSAMRAFGSLSSATEIGAFSESSQTYWTQTSKGSEAARQRGRSGQCYVVYMTILQHIYKYLCAVVSRLVTVVSLGQI